MKTFPKLSFRNGPLELRTRALDLLNEGPVVTAEIILWDGSDPPTNNRLAYWLPQNNHYHLILENNIFKKINSVHLTAFWSLLEKGDQIIHQGSHHV